MTTWLFAVLILIAIVILAVIGRDLRRERREADEDAARLRRVTGRRSNHHQWR